MIEHTVFVSYSRKDSSRVQQAVALLEAGGAAVFRDLDDIQFGDRWEAVIRAKLAESERILVFWSIHARDSEWVGREWMIALEMDKRLVPVLLDDTPMPESLSQFHALTNFMPPARPRWQYLAWGGGGIIAVLLAGVLLLPTLQVARAPQSALPEPELSQEFRQPADPSAPDSPFGTGAYTPDANPQYPQYQPPATAPIVVEEHQNLPLLPLLPWLAGLLLVVLLGYGIRRYRLQRKAADQVAGEQLLQKIFEER